MTESATILLAEDDVDDRELIREAFAENGFEATLCCVGDGQELVDYLRHDGDYAPPVEAPRPDLILLDLNMPRMDGREALAAIKNDPTLRAIPIVVMTTSGAESDINASYDLGANSYIRKPVKFSSLLDVTKGLAHYWLETVERPT